MRTFKHNRFSAKSKKSGDENLGPYTTAPEILAVYRAIVELSKFFGWRRIGILTGTEIPPKANISENFEPSRVIERDGLTVVFSSYNETDPLQSFLIYSQHEIRVFVFHGTVRLHLHALGFAAAPDHYFIGKEKVVLQNSVYSIQ